jgi:sialic acid synthase SpsE
MLETIFRSRKPLFIAEIGLNHNGDIDTAEKMIEKAAESGAHAVKFQTFIPGLMNSPLTSSLMKGDAEPVKDDSIINFFETFVFSLEQWIRLKKKSEECGVVFFSAPFDPPSVDLLESINTPLYKIASSEVTNPVLLKKIASTGKPVILSTGMSTADEIDSAIRILEGNGSGDIVLLHCVSLYPLDDSEANLSRIISLRERFCKTVGISDHSRDYASVMIAAAFGAAVIEKHFKLTDDHDCPDKDVSLSPGQFMEMVIAAKRGALMAGDGKIEFSGRESETAKGAKRSLFAAKDLSAGSIISGTDILCLRPGTGIPASRIYEFTGRKLKTGIKQGSILKPEYFL